MTDINLKARQLPAGRSRSPVGAVRIVWQASNGACIFLPIAHMVRSAALLCDGDGTHHCSPACRLQGDSAGRLGHASVVLCMAGCGSLGPCIVALAPLALFWALIRLSVEGLA